MSGLRLWSEPYAASGNVSAEGATRTLKATHLDPLSLMVREAVQNSNDAGFNAGATEIGFRVAYQVPTTVERAALLSRVFGTEPPRLGVPGEPSLRQLLEDPSTGLLLVSDHGTTGLSGPTRADVTHGPEDRPEFVNFLRNIGAPQDTQTGGGTYGFGKAALFNVSRVRTIVVHTLCKDRAASESRFMAAGLGHEFDEAGKRFTGRHWWGVDSGDIAEPLRGDEANAMAEAIGLPRREAGDFGTTIAIVAPEFETWTNPDDALNQLLTAILVWCWPKMLEPGTPGHPRIQFKVTWRGNEVDVPGPNEVSLLRPFAEALSAIDAHERGGTPSRSVRRWPVSLLRPSLELGTLALKSIPAQLPFGSGLPAGQADSDRWPFTRWAEGRVGMVARMRRARLVVDYLDVPVVDSAGLDFAAVFLPAPSVDIDAALAASEPPSHDDWNVDQVADKRSQRIVRGVKRGIDSHVRDYLTTLGPGPVSPGARPSLGRLADSLATLLPGSPGPALGGWVPVPSGGGGSGGNGRRTNVSIEYSPPVLRQAEEGRILEVPFRTKLPTNGSARLQALIAVEVDGPGGSAERERPAGSRQARVLSWSALDDGLEIEGDVLEVEGGLRRWVCRVLVPDEDAVWHVEFQRVRSA